MMTTNTWKAAVTGNWNIASNWSLGHVPLATEDVAITLAGTYDVTLTKPQSVHSISLGASSGVETLTVTGNLTIASASTIGSKGSLIATGTLGGAGTLTNHGTLTLNGATINAPLVNQGEMLVEPNHPATTFINSSFVNVTGATLSVVGGAPWIEELRFAAGFTNFGQIGLVNQVGGDNAHITMATGTLTNAAGGIIETVPGAGGFQTITGNMINQGFVGLAATLSVDGNYTQSSGGTFGEALGGFGPTTPQLAVTATASLSGTLLIYPGSNFHPVPGNTFAVMTYKSRLGDFTSLDGYSLGGGVQLNKAPGATEYDLKVVAAVADKVPPVVTGFAVTPLVSLAKTIQFSVTYSDNVALDASTLSSTNVRVTGPGGFSQLATLVSVSMNRAGINGTPRTVVYSITPTIGRVDVEADGTYTAALVAGSIKDTKGNAVAAATLGTFKIAVQPKLVFSVQPASVVAGKAIAPAVVVKVEDQAGILLSTDASTVKLAVAQGSAGTVTGAPTATAVKGVATFKNIILTTASATEKLIATDGLDTSAISNPFTVKPAAAAKLVFVKAPGSAVIGNPISPAVKVAVEDMFGNIVITDTSSVRLSLASGPAGTVFGGVLSENAMAGIATFSDLLLSKAGSYMLKAVDGVLEFAASGSFSVS